MKKTIRYVGMDVHKDTIAIAVATKKTDPRVVATVPNSWPSLRRELGPSKSLYCCCYEAGPYGYEIERCLRSADIDCVVIAPSLVPQQTGDRIKTDRRDACKLARYLRSGGLTAVHVPDEIDEAMRDLVRARADAKNSTAHGSPAALLNSPSSTRR